MYIGLAMTNLDKNNEFLNIISIELSLMAPNHYLDQYWFIINGNMYLNTLSQEVFKTLQYLPWADKLTNNLSKQTSH